MPKELSNSEFTSFAKRLQAALKRREVTASLSEIKEVIANLVADYDNQLTEELQHICLDALIRKYQPSALVEPESVLSQMDEDGNRTLFTEGDCDTENITNALIQVTDEQKHQIVSLKASEMGIQLATTDIDAIADTIDSVVSSTEELINQIEQAITAYIEQIKQHNQQKIDGMIFRLAQKIQLSNQETATHFNNQSQKFNEALVAAQQDLKSSILQSLKRFAIE